MTDLAERVAAVYDFAADHIETYGWTQHQLFDESAGLPVEQSPACLVGAIKLAVHDGVDIDAVVPNVGIFAAALNALRAEIDGGRPLATVRWNNNPGRERWEVVELLRMMAKRARAGDLDLA